MSLTLIKTQSVKPCKCGSTDFKIINGAKVCMICFTYIPQEFVRDIKSKRN